MVIIVKGNLNRAFAADDEFTLSCRGLILMTRKGSVAYRYFESLKQWLASRTALRRRLGQALELWMAQ
ncbi:hypothetical protein CWO84_23915 [Methylomonas sp. Kb3]|nr:hypothetical protein CWO84_23915 [Methylomonas sp. Kb3]